MRAAPRDVPAKDIPGLGKLDEVMDVQATVADPQFSKIGAASYGDADYAAFADVSERIQATSLKTKSFSKGPGFDALADRLGEVAKRLGEAAASKGLLRRPRRDEGDVQGVPPEVPLTARRLAGRRPPRGVRPSCRRR